MTDPSQDVQVFAERVLRRPLRPHQLEVARSDRFVSTVAKARRAGGTVTTSLESVRSPDTPKRRSERLSDKDALSGHRDALPVSFDQRVATQIVADDNAWIREFLREVARLSYRAVTSCGACLEPAQGAHLTPV